MNKWIVCFSLIFMGCSTTPRETVSESLPQATANIVKEEKELTTSMLQIVIPSHGFFGDKLSIAVKGGANATQLRLTLKKVESNGGGSVLITSKNPDLSRAVIEGALESSDIYSNTTLFYQGDESNFVKVEKAADKKINLHFINY